MLARSQRLTSGQEFAATIRGGRRAGSSRLVVHLAAGDGSPMATPPRVGLVVSKAVGNAVTRNQVKRRLRHLLRDRLPTLPHGTLLVVRALTPAGTARSAELAGDLDSALARALQHRRSA